MNSGNVAVKILKKSIIAILLLAVVIVVIKGAGKAYDFGHAVFMDEAVSTEENAREITITISEGDTALDVGKMLERRGLVKNAYVFFVQSYCYEAGRNLKPGSYDLNTSMDAKTMMNSIVTQYSNAQEEKKGEQK